jgi:hypothetical protein
LHIKSAMYKGKNQRREIAWPYHTLIVAVGAVLAGLLLVPPHKYATVGFIVTIGWMLCCMAVFFVTAKHLDKITTAVKECCKGKVIDILTEAIERGKPTAPIMDRVDHEVKLFQEYSKKRPLYHLILAISTVGVAVGLGAIVAMSL